ncbi:MAG: type IV-A pilus assembly ATPase PilB [Proteobacteria bacterium]|nr:type IV-A pilus assembly ATPase PilB [Pseudomonadota bacterium]MBU1388533.1 type IV-A pilus assembly ATPase PilB [Pseudomonadota bacterium]MBU1544830.1 type IV-A pilus assembly ATPase PilB [Pseudomonadota bacterium]MBU2431386.1 type IV-A pilus assembly ATPase PilB [Pseudomonadota bacterium]MBU2482690.1 type IV-A pilus assembly ATPase PilB [Pseudomonadota bacterium]
MAKASSLKSTIKDQSGAGKTKIGELLSKEGQITSIQLEEALNVFKKSNERLSSILLNKGYIDPDTIVNVLGRLYNYDVVKISDLKPDPKALAILPYEMAKPYMVFPYALKGEELFITMVEPTDTSIIEDLQKKLGKTIQISVSTENDVIQAFRDFYKISDDEYKSFLHFDDDAEDDEPVTSVDDFGSLVSEAAEEMEVGYEADDHHDQFMASDAPIIKLVNGILTKAISDGVSDIHIEPFEKSFQVRYRLDGSMYKAMNLPISIKNAVISRIKILAELDIAERRVPQDGRIKLRFGKKKSIDFRVSTLPTLFGESIVMRILDQSALNIDFTKLGFEATMFEQLKRCISMPYGLLLVTGPTGSGKTTTLYSILNRLNNDDIKILTAEDPVEFNFKGINQVPVREEIGMTFAAALKAFLRQDPDIIMVGEIRDMDTAEIAIKAAMTGHLVFATLHTNDCPSTIGRLIDIGIPPYMLASAVTMVLSQRLARRLCPECKQVVTGHNEKDLELQGFSKKDIPNLKIYGPKGCSHCNGTGYKGRVGLYELMEVTDEVAKAISAQVPEDQLRKVAVSEGMVTLRDAGLEKIKAGQTSLDEVMKKTTITKESLPAYLVNPDFEMYEDKDVIIREGNTDIDFFKLVQGGLYVVKGGKKITEIVQPGDYFGEMSAITGEPRSASIISKGRSKVKRYPGDKLLEIIEKYPDVARHLFGVLAARLDSTDKRFVNMLNQIKKSQIK